MKIIENPWNFQLNHMKNQWNEEPVQKKYLQFFFPTWPVNEATAMAAMHRSSAQLSWPMQILCWRSRSRRSPPNPPRILQHTPILQGSLKVFREFHHPEPQILAPNSAPSSNDVPENIEASWFNTYRRCWTTPLRILRSKSAQYLLLGHRWCLAGV